MIRNATLWLLCKCFGLDFFNTIERHRGVAASPIKSHLSRDRRFPKMWYVWSAKPQISLRVRAVWSEPLLVAWIFYDCLATERTSFPISKLKRRLQARLSLFMSKCHIVGNHMPWFIYNEEFGIAKLTLSSWSLVRVYHSSSISSSLCRRSV